MDGLHAATDTGITGITDAENGYFGLFALLISLGIPAVVSVCRVYFRSLDKRLYRDHTGWHGSEKIPDALEKRSRKTHRARVAATRKKARRGSTKA